MPFPSDLLADLRGRSWEDDALCRGRDASLFFGPNTFEPKRERLARESAAKEICQTCPALVPCRQYAVLENESFGVWGGLGETERRGLAEKHRNMAKKAV